jgi:hypothetical protein
MPGRGVRIGSTDEELLATSAIPNQGHSSSRMAELPQ